MYTILYIKQSTFFPPSLSSRMLTVALLGECLKVVNIEFTSIYFTLTFANTLLATLKNSKSTDLKYRIPLLRWRDARRSLAESGP